MTAENTIQIEGPYSFKDVNGLKTPAYIFLPGGERKEVGKVTVRVSGGMTFAVDLDEDYKNIETASFDVPMRYTYLNRPNKPQDKRSMTVFDNRSRYWFDDSDILLMFLRNQQNWANDTLRARGHLFVNEVLDLLDIPRTPRGQLDGWLYTDTERDQVDFGCWDQEVDQESIELKLNITGEIYTKI